MNNFKIKQTCMLQGIEGGGLTHKSNKGKKRTKLNLTLKVFASIISILAGHGGYSMEQQQEDTHLLIGGEPLFYEYNEEEDSYFFEYKLANPQHLTAILDSQKNLEQDEGVFTHCTNIEALETVLVERFLTSSGIEARQNVDETRIKVNNPLDFPWHSSGKLRMHYLGRKGSDIVSVYGGTGILIAPDIVLTAGHNLFNAASGLSPFVIEFLPGINGRPGGTNTEGHLIHTHGALAKDFVVHKKFKDSKDRVWDIGLIQLKKELKLNFPYANMSLATEELLGGAYSIAGYPGDLGHWFMYEDSSVDKRPAEMIENGNLLTHYMNTNKGQSGSGLVFSDKSTKSIKVFGVHVAGKEFQGNTAVLINEEKKNKIEKWIKGFSK